MTIEELIKGFNELRNRIGGYDLYGDAESAPCYTVRWYVPSRLRNPEDIQLYVEYATSQTIGVVMMSVTAQDSNHQVVLDTIRERCPTANITGGRSVHHGGYPVWFITIPGTKK